MKQDLKNIIYVDDEPNIREVATMCLEMMGDFNVTSFSSGRELLERWKSVVADLILLDVMMPELDGPSTLKALQEQDGFGTPVIFMTARVQPDEVRHYIELGAKGVIAKPFDPMQVSQQITEIWEGI